MIDLIPISIENLDIVIGLLKKRNNTLPEYVTWKYGPGSPAGQHGFIAFDRNTPVGCFGLVPKKLKLCNGTIQECGWFADWYVIPEARGTGTGKKLLDAISQTYSIVFGHPGPKTASALCLRNGWCPISFQSRRRFIFNKWHFFKRKTKHWLKALYLLVNEETLNKLKAPVHRSNISGINAEFVCETNYADLIQKQPVPNKIHRTYQIWISNSYQIHYMIDVMNAVETRWRVLYSSPLVENLCDKIWLDFLNFAKRNCDYLEIITTNPELDKILAKFGGVFTTESPVLFFSKEINTCDVTIHGWDRENWMFITGPL